MEVFQIALQILSPVSVLLIIALNIKNINKSSTDKLVATVERDTEINLTLKNIQSDIKTIKEQHMQELRELKEENKAQNEKYNKLEKEVEFIKRDLETAWDKFDDLKSAYLSKQ